MVLSNIPIYIISLDGDTSFNFKKYFSNVTIFSAIDLRNKNINELYEANLISLSVYNSLLNGRKWHQELQGSGAVGLWQSYKKLLTSIKNTKENVIICEQDCIINDYNGLIDIYNNLKNINFDIAVMGGINMGKNDIINNNFDEINLDAINLKFNLIKFKGLFILLHCVIWTPTGINKVLKYLNQPQEMQLDAFFSQLSNFHNLRILLNTGSSIATQKLHKSTLQNDNICFLCDSDPKLINAWSADLISYYAKLVTILIISILIIILIYKFIYNKYSCKC